MKTVQVHLIIWMTLVILFLWIISSPGQNLSKIIRWNGSRVQTKISDSQGGGLGIFTDRDQRSIFGGFEF